MRSHILRGLSLALLATPAAAMAQTQAAPSASGPQVQQVWIRATAPHQTSAAAYMTLRSASGDRLVGGSSPVADMAMLHDEERQGNVERMRPMDQGLRLPPNVPVTLAPGGTHLMLMGLKHPLRAGETVPLQLTFANAGTRTVTAVVTPIGASGPGPTTGGAR